MGGTGGDGHREMGCKGPGGAAPTPPTMHRQGFRVLWQPRNNCPVHHLELLERVLGLVGGSSSSVEERARLG